MEIKIGDVKRAYVNKDGDVSVKNLVFRVKLYDPTSMPPELYHDRWKVYAPYDLRVWMEPGATVQFFLGMGFMVPPGFVIYLFLNRLYEGQAELDEMFITPGNNEEVVLTVTAIKSFYLRKYMHIASFIIIPVLNTEPVKELMCDHNRNEHR